MSGLMDFIRRNEMVKAGSAASFKLANGPESGLTIKFDAPVVFQQEIRNAQTLESFIRGTVWALLSEACTTKIISEGQKMMR